MAAPKKNFVYCNTSKGSRWAKRVGFCFFAGRTNVIDSLYAAKLLGNTRSLALLELHPPSYVQISRKEHEGEDKGN
jgi:hypothetical protein